MVNFMHNKTTGNIISIQLLRAIAALSIVYLHCTTAGNYKLFSTGAFGVDIFFIISGFIIAYMVSKNTENFLIKRIIRIVPLYFLATVAMTLTVMFFSGFLDNRTISISGFIKSILFIPGPENSGLPILIQGWSLNYEMFFYVIMFLCILFVKNKKYLTIACISVLTSIIIVLHLINSTNFIINYYKNSLFLEFIYGMILYHVYIYINKHTGGGGGIIMPAFMRY
jgi:peptidoglycan/LPS O-acetylase OafA/YrhL